MRLDGRVWGWPIALGLLTLVGLLAALIGGSGLWLWLSWAAFCAPIAVVIRYCAPAFVRAPGAPARLTPRHADGETPDHRRKATSNAP